MWGPPDVCFYFDRSSVARCFITSRHYPIFIFRHFHNVWPNLVAVLNLFDFNWFSINIRKKLSILSIESDRRKLFCPTNTQSCWYTRLKHIVMLISQVQLKKIITHKVIIIYYSASHWAGQPHFISSITIYKFILGRKLDL